VRVSIGQPGGSSYSSSSNGTIMGNAFSSVPAPLVSADGTFTATNVAPGSYLVRASLPAAAAQGWVLRSALSAGRDLLDVPLEIGATDVRDLVLTFSDQRSELAGSLQTPGGQPAPNYFVVVFTVNRALWGAGARRVQVTRPDTKGSFTVRDLPAGEYFIAALSDVAEGEWADPEFLEQVVPASVRVTITEGARTVQNLRIAG
jgi:hypothetical protein